MKKTFYVLCFGIVIFSIVLAFVLILHKNNVKNSNESSDFIIDKNVSSNFANGGKVVKTDECIYYSFPSGNKFFESIYKKSLSKNKSVEIRKFLFSTPREISITENYVFFKLSGFAANSGLYRCQKNGKKLKCIIDETVIYYMIFNDKIYYTLDGDEQIKGLFVCDLNGENQTKIINEDISNFLCTDNGIFFASQHILKKFDYYTSETTCVAELDSAYICNLTKSNNELFFIACYSEDVKALDELYRFNISSGSYTKIYEANFGGIYVLSDNTIIFNDNDFDSGLKILDVETNSQKTLKIEGFSDEIYPPDFFVFEKDVYFYRIFDSKQKLYHVNLDEMEVRSIAIQ